MELEELLPTNPTFTIGLKTYTLRKIGVKDLAWAAEKHGGHAEAMAMFATKDFVSIAGFAYHQLSEAEKNDFPPYDVERRDDEGDIKKIRVSGPAHLVEKLSDDEIEGMLKAMMRAMVMANPKIEPAVLAMMEEEKKRTADALNQLIGAKSLTSSQASTDTPPNNSEHSVPETSTQPDET